MADQFPVLPASLAVVIEPFTDEELDEAIAARVEGREVPAKIGNFVLDSEPKAEWALRKLAALDARRAEVVATHSAWIEQIETSLIGNLTQIDPRAEIFRHALEQYAKNRREADDRAKTVRLPSGRVTTTKTQRPVACIGNEEAVLSWATRNLDEQQYDYVVKQSPKVLVSKLRDLIDVAVTDNGYRVVWRETGEVIPGMYVEEPGRITATVKVNE